MSGCRSCTIYYHVYVVLSLLLSLLRNGKYAHRPPFIFLETFYYTKYIDFFNIFFTRLFFYYHYELSNKLCLIIFFDKFVKEVIFQILK